MLLSKLGGGTVKESYTSVVMCLDNLAIVNSLVLCMCGIQ